MNVVLPDAETHHRCHYSNEEPAITLQSHTCQPSNYVHSILLAVWRGLAQTSERIERTAGWHGSTTGLWQDKSAHIARRSAVCFSLRFAPLRQCIGICLNVRCNRKSSLQLIFLHIAEFSDVR